MKLDIYREILLKINNELNIDGEYSLSIDELQDKFEINNIEDLKKIYSNLYSKNKLYNFEEVVTLEEPFLMKIDLNKESIIFSLNPVWKRKLFFKGKLISESLTEVWNMLLGDTKSSHPVNLFTLGKNDNDLTNFKQKLKKSASIKGGYDQMVIIGLIERATTSLELTKLATKYDLFDDKDNSSNVDIDTSNVSLDEYKSNLKTKVNSYPSYKRMSLLGFINRATSKEELANIFDGEEVDKSVMKRIDDSFSEKKKIAEKVNIQLSEVDEEFEALKSSIRSKVMKMSTFNKMTILGFISRTTTKKELLDLVEKYQIK